MTTAAIYVRISQDRSGDELGITRQREDCEKLLAVRGWELGPVFVDDDRSAFSGRPRPGYNELLAAIETHAIDAVVAWHPDRLHRSPVELERFIDVVSASGVDVATVQAGEYDLGTAAGRMTARVVGAVARHESEQKSERIRRQREQMALQGRPHGGRRAFGYDPTGAQVVEVEAALIREATGRVFAGESVRSIAIDWNTRKLRSSSGRAWSVTSMRSMLTGPRLAGLRVHRGDVIGQAAWPAILTREEHDRLRVILGNPRATSGGRPPTSLLGGILRCHCGAKMHASTRSDGTRRYVCATGPGSGQGCGRTAIQAERTEAIVVEAVLRRLDGPALAEELGRTPEPGTGDDVEELEARLADLAEIFGMGEITRGEWIRARKGVEARLESARRSRAAHVRFDVLREHLEPGTLRAAWPALSLEKQRAALASIVDRVVIEPAARVGKFDPERITIPPDAWRA